MNASTQAGPNRVDHRDEANDDEHLFAQLYVALRRFANVIRPPDVDADDLVQEALARGLALRPLHEYDDPGAYLRTAMVRLASNQRRTFARRRVALTRLHSATGGDEQPYPSDLDDLRRLPPADRAILFLTAVEGWAYLEVARVVGCTEMAARARASRALRRLRAQLTEERRNA